MKQSLQLRLGQSLTMTPQLQQAIRLLQLSTLELRTEIQQALETNPMLDLEDELDFDQETELDEQAAEDEQPEEEAYEDPEDELAAENPEQMPDELPVDSAWDDIYEPTLPASGSASPDDDRPLEFGDQSSESLREHLLWQLRMTALLERDIAIGEAVIDAVDEDGFLTLSVEEITGGFPPEWELEVDEVMAVLHVVQNFDPPGVGARNLQESLSLQLRQLELELPWRAEAQELVDHHFDLLANRDYTTLKRRMKLDDDDLIAVVKLIQSLNPRPGGQVSNSRPEYVVPDVVVRKERDAWRVELNPEAAPRLRINSHYANLIKQVQDSSDSTYMKNHLQEARWFLKSLQSRNETLLKVATAIVERQQGFLEHGEVAMKALVLADIAETVGMHESTISRVTTRKYLHTPRGVFELKYFFSSHVSTSGGGECSSTAIRALIKRLVAEENPAKPLSDSKLAAVLSDQGINVARRTVAKYREAMAIPPSNERKRLA